MAFPGSIPVPIAAETCPKFIPFSIPTAIPLAASPGPPIISPNLAPSGLPLTPMLAAISGFI